jgi:hypothetical protein
MELYRKIIECDELSEKCNKLEVEVEILREKMTKLVEKEESGIFTGEKREKAFKNFVKAF